MATRKQAAVQEAPPVEEPLPYILEPLDDDLLMRLKVWGNSTVLLIDQIKDSYPGWAKMFDDLRITIGDVIQGESQ